MEIDKELFRATEGKLYSYFRKKKEIEKLNYRIKELNEQIEEIESDIRNTNVKIDYYQPSIPITERVQTSSTGTSYAEGQIIKAINEMEKERANRIRIKLKLKAKIRETQNYITYMEQNLESLSEENKRFIELKYGDEADMITIANKMNMARTTVYRKREELVDDIARHDKGINAYVKSISKSYV